MSWDVAKLEFSRSKTLDGPAGVLLGLSFGSSGSKMYCAEMLNCVREYDLGINYDPFTETYVQKIDLSSDGVFNVTDVAFNPTGTKMYVNSLSNSEIHDYNLGTPWDISTAAHSSTRSVSQYSVLPYGFRFKPDGTMLYITSQGNDSIVGYSLATAWDISTMSKIQEISILSECVGMNENGLDFKSDGTKMFVSCYTASNILEYGLTTAWNIETASYIRSSGCTVQMDNVKFDSDGNVVYVTAGGMYEYTLPVGKHRAIKSS